jgi:hypothetical protein
VTSGDALVILAARGHSGQIHPSAGSLMRYLADEGSSWLSLIAPAPGVLFKTLWQAEPAPRDVPREVWCHRQRVAVRVQDLGRAR